MPTRKDYIAQGKTNAEIDAALNAKTVDQVKQNQQEISQRLTGTQPVTTPLNEMTAKQPINEMTPVNEVTPVSVPLQPVSEQDLTPAQRDQAIVPVVNQAPVTPVSEVTTPVKKPSAGINELTNTNVGVGREEQIVSNLTE